MVLVQRFGKLDLFVTMTRNPEWEEIQEQLQLGQRPRDRLDLTSRVFREKLQDLKDQLFKRRSLGKLQPMSMPLSTKKGVCHMTHANHTQVRV